MENTKHCFNYERTLVLNFIRLKFRKLLYLTEDERVFIVFIFQNFPLLSVGIPGILYFKVHIFLEGHKILSKSSPILCSASQK